MLQKQGLYVHLLNDPLIQTNVLSLYPKVRGVRDGSRRF
jgi:hypothetical protein